MMPVSQLVVLVSYNFWVQLVQSDLPREKGLKKRREQGKVERLKG